MGSKKVITVRVDELAPGGTKPSTDTGMIIDFDMSSYFVNYTDINWFLLIIYRQSKWPTRYSKISRHFSS